MTRTPARIAVILVVWAISLCAPGVVRASFDSSPDCGIYSLYTAMRIEGVRPQLPDLLKPQYISTKEGSTLDDLRLAAQDHGMHASIMINLTVSDLSRSRSPMILHVKNEYDAPSYNHFILCVPGGNGLVALYDAPQEPVWTTGDELAPLWDGTALAVSTRPIGWNFGYGGVFKWGLGAATFIACAVAGRPRALAFRRRSLSAAGQVAVIVGAAVAFAAVQHRGTSQGYLSQSVAVTAIQSAVFKSSVPLADAGDVESAAGGAGYLVDARTSSDFQAGHIGAAINIPAGASRRARAEAMAGLPRDATLIVYCESSSCPFAPFVARRLAADGFTSVRVFTGGWEQWVAMHRRSAEGM